MCHSKKIYIPRNYSATSIGESMKTVPKYNSNSFSMCNQAYNEARFIVLLLAARSYHIPGNNWYQDWIQFLRNNHPLFGIFCHHKLHPLRLGQRIVCLIGSVAFGLSATNCVYLYYNYNNSNMNEILFRVHMENVENSLSTDKNQIWEVTHGMVALWTFGGLFHSAFDIILWFVSACSCCLPGGSCERCGHGQKVGGYIVVVVVIVLVAFTSFMVVLRASLESRENIFDRNINIQDVKWGQVNDVEAFSFILGYLIELSLALLFYYPFMATLLFSGILGCGKLPFLGGRPREIKAEIANRLKEAKKYRRNDIDVDISFSDEEEYEPNKVVMNCKLRSPMKV